MNGWPTKTLGQLCRLVSGQHIDSKDYNTESRGVGYLTGPSDFGLKNPLITKWTEHPKIKAKRGDILITVKGSGVGRINLLDEAEVAISRQLMAVRTTDADPRFIYTFLSSTFDHFQRLSTGTAIPGISRDQVLGLGVPTPPITEQRRIVGLLDEAFEAIAAAKANAAKNLRHARRLFESYRQEAFAPRSNDWTARALGTVASFRNGINFTKSSTGQRVKVVGVKDFKDSFRVPLTGLDEVAIDGELSELDALKDGDILAVRSNGNVDLIGRTLLAENIASIITHSGFTIRIRRNTDDLRSDYLCHFMKSTAARDRLIESGIGTNIKSLNQQGLANLMIPFPSCAEQEGIVAAIEKMSLNTQRLESIYLQKLGALEALKQSLLHHAFTGQL